MKVTVIEEMSITILTAVDHYIASVFHFLPVDLQQHQKKFIAHFGGSDSPIHFFFAPGRVCLIGEHLDYNGGFVLPCALSQGTYLLARKRNDRMLKMISLNDDSPLEILGDEIKNTNQWSDYPLGVINEFQKLTAITHGFDMLFTGDLPRRVGLSSSASIEVVTAFALNKLLNQNFSSKEIALLSLRAENNFVGVQCGIMDQYAAAFGKKDCAIFLNCVEVSHQYVDANLNDHEFIISNTMKQRQLESSAFNVRYQECNHALATMQRLLTVKYLADATPQQFESIEHFFSDENTRRRAHHIVDENDRVKRACAALTKGDVKILASLMNESHASLRDFYEVSCFELEAITKAARAIDGCLASRISGAGFGGCNMSLIRKGIREKFCEEVFSSYKKQTGLSAEFYEVKIGDGVTEVFL